MLSGDLLDCSDLRKRHIRELRIVTKEPDHLIESPAVSAGLLSEKLETDDP